MSGRDQMSDHTAELHVPSENTRLVQNGVIHAAPVGKCLSLNFNVSHFGRVLQVLTC